MKIYTVAFVSDDSNANAIIGNYSSMEKAVDAARRTAEQYGEDIDEPKVCIGCFSSRLPIVTKDDEEAYYRVIVHALDDGEYENEAEDEEEDDEEEDEEEKDYLPESVADELLKAFGFATCWKNFTEGNLFASDNEIDAEVCKLMQMYADFHGYKGVKMGA